MVGLVSYLIKAFEEPECVMTNIVTDAEKNDEEFVESLTTSKLDSKTKKFFSDILDTVEKLSKSDSLEKIKVDITKLGKPSNPFNIPDFKDPNIYNILKDNKLGFPVTSVMINRSDDSFDKFESSKIFPYFYEDGNNRYFIGVISFNESVKHIDGFLNVDLIDVSSIVDNANEVMHAIYTDFKTYARDKFKNDIKGFSSKPKNTQMKQKLIKTGIHPSNLNKEILVDKL